MIMKIIMLMIVINSSYCLFSCLALILLDVGLINPLPVHLVKYSQL